MFCWSFFEQKPESARTKSGAGVNFAAIGKMRREGVQAQVWALGQQLQQSLRALAAKFPDLKLSIGGQPCAPSIAFGLGDDSPAGKALMIRGMLSRGYLFSSQLYVMHPHTEPMIHEMLSTLEEVLTEVCRIQNEGRLQAEAGPQVVNTGFARLA